MMDTNRGIILCYCNLTAEIKTTQKPGPNHGRQFWSCSKRLDRCKYFKWDDEVRQPSTPLANSPRTPLRKSSPAMQSTISPPTFTTARAHKNESSSNNTESEDTGNGAPFCEIHNIFCVQKTVSKEGSNKGRLFWSCPGAYSCHFSWCDTNAGFASPRTPSVNSPSVGHDNRTHASVPVGPTTTSNVVRLELCSKSLAKVKEVDEIEEEEDFENQKTVVFDTAVEEFVLVSLPDKNRALSNAISNLFEKDSSLGGIHRSTYEWVFAFSQIGEVKSLIRSMPNTRIYIQDIPDSVVKFVHKYKPVDTKDQSRIDWSKYPSSLVSTLRPFQKEGVTFGIEREGRCLIGDEMGLGKTIQAMSIAYYFHESWPLLIICPATLRYNWGNEIEKFLKIYPEQITIVTQSAIKPNNKVNIISYELASKNADDLVARNFKCVIADESHYLKNFNTDRVKNCRKIFKNAERVIFITGTPALSRPVELYPQIDLILGGSYWLSFDDFSKRYCDAKETHFGVDRKGSSNRIELNYLLSRTLMIRRRKNDVLKDLPAKTRQQIFLCIDPADLRIIKTTTKQRKKYVQEMNRAASMDDHNDNQWKKNSAWLELFQQTGLAKLKAVSAYVADLLEKGVKFLIFGYHTKVLDGIEEAVKKKKVDYIRIDGSTPQGNRQKLVETFRTTKSYRVAILSIVAAGTGLTFTPCSTVIFAELFWTPGSLAQAEDRVHRIGQTEKVTVQYLLAKGTLDDDLWPMIKKKIEVVGETLDAKNEADQWEDGLDTKYEKMDKSVKVGAGDSWSFKRLQEEETIHDDLENFDSRMEDVTDVKAEDEEILLEDQVELQANSHENKGDYDNVDYDADITIAHEEEQLPAKKKKASKRKQVHDELVVEDTGRKTSKDIGSFMFRTARASEAVTKRIYEKSEYVFKRSFFDRHSPDEDTQDSLSNIEIPESIPPEAVEQPKPVRKSIPLPFIPEEVEEETDVTNVFEAARNNKKRDIKKPTPPKPSQPKLQSSSLSKAPTTPPPKPKSTPSKPSAVAEPAKEEKKKVSSFLERFAYKGPSTPSKPSSSQAFSPRKPGFNSPSQPTSLKRKREEPEEVSETIVPGVEFEDIDFDAVLEECNLSQAVEPASKKSRFNGDNNKEEDKSPITRVNRPGRSLFYGL